MMDCGSADVSGYYEIDPNAKLGLFPWPAPAGKKAVTNTGMSVLYGINPKSSKQDACLVFAQWVATPDGAKNSFSPSNNLSSGVFSRVKIDRYSVPAAPSRLVIFV